MQTGSLGLFSEDRYREEPEKRQGAETAEERRRRSGESGQAIAVHGIDHRCGADSVSQIASYHPGQQQRQGNQRLQAEPHHQPERKRWRTPRARLIGGRRVEQYSLGIRQVHIPGEQQDHSAHGQRYLRDQNPMANKERLSAII